MNFRINSTPQFSRSRREKKIERDDYWSEWPPVTDMGNLREMALDMGGEMEQQNRQLDGLCLSASEVSASRMTFATQTVAL